MFLCIGGDTSEWGWARRYGGLVVEGVHRKNENRVCHQNLHGSLGTGTEMVESPQQGVWYRAGDEAGALDLEQRRESEDCLPTSLTCVVNRFPGMCTYVLFVLNRLAVVTVVSFLGSRTVSNLTAIIHVASD